MFNQLTDKYNSFLNFAFTLIITTTINELKVEAKATMTIFHIR